MKFKSKGFLIKLIYHANSTHSFSIYLYNAKS